MIYGEVFNISNYLIEECNLKKGRKDKIALYYKNSMYTYGDMNNKVNQFGNYMRELGLDMENRIGLLMPDEPEYIFLFLGAIRVGVVPLLINIKLDLENINSLIDESRIKYLFTTGDFYNKLRDYQHELLKQIIVVSDKKDYIYNLNTSCKLAPTTKDDIAFWQFTSGSSGRPKGAMHFHQNVLTVIDSFGKQILKSNSEDIFYSHPLISFALGVLFTIYIPFAVGGSAIIKSNDNDNLFSVIDDINKFKPTVFIAVPMIFNSILKLLDSNDIGFHNMRLCVTGGEGLPKSVYDSWKERFNCEILQEYGCTESLAAVLSNRIGEAKIGSVGKIVPGYKAEILDEENNVVEDGMPGELFIAGNSIMQGYWNNKDKTHEIKYGNGVKTGDIFYKDNEGYFWYIGRNTDTFKVNGVWVNGSKIESVIADHPLVQEGAVAGEISDEKTTIIVAYIVIGKSSADAIVSDLKKSIRQNIGRDMCPKKFYIVKSLPRGLTGKLKRSALKDTSVCKIIL
ncbi:AMP-binding protein [Clostridium felsineum]|uniref:4-hydroxybenzoate--CoA/benzoate--CoA ligase n=1 Tax=Clostridium felsineum TaxID=36839 RepID=A0A1S8L768_9CLOT|nr:AMP-binding protein [Clostridium felsineum]URZ07158.1 4-hydroxybenzoate--CoA/benzoate--CoA ligase [Clostridium felsineum]URZ12188.1 4-hydroxybenzoate--CoA/benzoate--CoA ligase [Clostridium felsineum]